MTIMWLNIGLGNGLSPVQHQAIAWTNDEISTIESLTTKTQQNSDQNTVIFMQKMYSKMSSARWLPFCPGLNLWSLYETTARIQ